MKSLFGFNSKVKEKLIMKEAQINWKSSDEAIELIQKQIELGMSNGDFKPRKHMVKAYELAVEALEKQISKTPKIKSWSPALCPSCGNELSEDLGDGYYKHYYGLSICECGQKLKWED